jgi:lipopolysaccharide/colanic/teichoic acid biosynthesis glycosyltransferase
MGIGYEARRLDRPATGSMAAKRAFDIVVAAVVLVIASPLLLLTALAVRQALGSPLLFRQERAGKEMRPFHIAKFRTMTDARDDSGNWLPDNLRQTPLTRFIRRIRVDELPQLFAVLRGDMSFIGPRPLPLSILVSFGELGRARCSIRPGMTGWAQVNGNTLLSDEQKLALDVWYVDNHNLMLDFRILVLTLWTLIRGEKLGRKNIERAFTHLRGRASASSI